MTRPATKALFLLAGAGLALLAFTLPMVPSTGLDASWSMGLGRFFAEGRQWGPEVVFTYGPLGWTMGNMYWGEQWGALVTWQVLQAIAIAALVLWQAQRLPLLRRVWFLAFFVLLGARGGDLMQQAAIALLGLELIHRSRQPVRWTELWPILPLAVLALVKFTNLVLAGGLLALAAVAPLSRREWRAAFAGPVAFALAFVAGWILCGQNPLHLPTYLINSLDISSGYVDAMGAPCPSSQLLHGVAVAGCLVAFLVLAALGATARLHAVTLALAGALYLFLNWKHGFVRADGHQALFYFAAFTTAVAAPRLDDNAPRFRWLKVALLVVAAGLAAHGLELASPGTWSHLPRGLVQRLTQNFALLHSSSAVRAGYDNVLRDARRELDLPLVRATVKDRPLDVLGWEQSMAILNQLPYAPRPVFQSYSAYTPRLAQLNADFYASPRAPEFVLFKHQTIDGRLESMDDSLVLAQLPRRYRYLFTEHGFTLWQRRTDAPADVRPTPVRRIATKLGQRVDLADLRGQNVWVRIEYRFNLLGQLRRLFFKPPQVNLALTEDSGATALYRLPVGIAATGFLVSPVSHEIGGFLRQANGDGGPFAVAIAVQPAPHAEDCVQDDVVVEIATLPPTPGVGFPSLSLGSPALPLTFVRGSAPFGSSLFPQEGRLDYFVHAPSTLVYRVPPGAAELRGGFGIFASAYAANNAHPTDGAVFVIRWHPAHGDTRELFRQLLRPRDVPADRGVHPLRVELPDRDGGELEFVTDPGPDGSAASDWTHWSDLRLENSP